ncbi:MAG: glycosyltransferase [Flavobacteriales bacterium]|nr:glycosyltransferase [Flavobacteriales bacterium]
MPKILRIINRFNLGGPTFNAAYLTKHMEHIYETLLIGGMQDDLEDTSLHIIEDLDLKPFIIPRMFREIDLKNDLKALKMIKEIIREFKPDIVHTHASKAGALGRLAAIQLKVPIIVHTFHGHVFHSYFGKLKTMMYKKIERYLAKRSSAIIAISKKQKEELVEMFKIASDEKVKVIQLGFELNKFSENMEEKRKDFRSKYNIREDTVAIGIVGRLVPIKNHAMFLRAMHAVKEISKKKIRGFIVGDGDERKNIERLAKELGLSFSDGANSDDRDDLTFTSWLKNVDEVNAGMDIIALTSKNEGTPVSLIEAQASNKPIVTTNVGGIEDIVLVNETALLADPNDQEAFNKLILDLIENDELRAKMGSKGWEFVKEKFHYDRLVKDFDELYSSLLEQRK